VTTVIINSELDYDVTSVLQQSRTSLCYKYHNNNKHLWTRNNCRI